MFGSFITHQWKAAVRSPLWHRKLVSNFFLGFLVLLVMLNLLGIGLFLDKLLSELAPDKNPVASFNRLLLYYLGIELLLRLLWQKMPGLSIQPYLPLPIKRSSLIHYLLSKSMWSLFNFLPLLVFVPFAFKAVAPQLTYSVWFWIAAIFTMLLCNSFLIVYVKRQALVKPKAVVGMTLFLIALIIVDYYGLISLSQFSATLFGAMLQNPVTLLAPVAMLILLYGLNYRLLTSHVYLDDLTDKQKAGAVAGGRFGFLEKYGELGQLLALELKLIFRNKRLKSALYMSLAMLLFGFLFYGQEEYQKFEIILIYMGILLSGMFMVSYGQFILCWESHYFDAIIANRIDPEKYFKAKFIILLVSCVVLYILLAPFAYFGRFILYLNTALVLFNIGINSFILLFKATYNRQRIDLQVSAMSMQGKDAKQFLIVLLLVIVPIAVYLPFKSAGLPNFGLLAIGALGTLGLLFYQPLLHMIVVQFRRQKYNIAAGFRQG